MDRYAVILVLLSISQFYLLLNEIGTEWYRRQRTVTVDFQTIDGELHQLDVGLTNSVKELKTTLGNHLDLDYRTLTLYHNGKILENKDTLNAHRLNKNPIIRVLSGSQFRFWVRRLTFEEEMWYAGDQNTTVGDVKAMIRDSDSIPNYDESFRLCGFKQRLYFRGNRLSDDSKLVDLGMKDESKMLLVVIVCQDLY
ncbi:hypothetical protein M3Y94_00944600 [Aphelenchoides besseyi]|nr:hypothetical protein M3Y94_00944600 [Aphelenchoides besseyi]